MAYVATTGKIWNEINESIDKMFAERHKFATNWYNYGLTKIEFDKICFESFVSAEEKKLMQDLGKRFFTEKVSLTVNLKGASASTTYSLDFPPHTLVPSHWDSYHDGARPTVRDERIIEIVRLRHEASKKVKDEHDAFKEKVRKLFNSAPSVNAIDKSWPAIRDLLSPATIQRMDSKPEKKTVLRDQVGEDTMKELSVHMLKAKVGA